MKTFGAIWRKSFKEIPEYFQPFRRAPDLRKTSQMERKNSTPFSRISKFFQPIFWVTRISHMQNFDTTPMPVAYCQCWKFERNRNSQFREKSKFAFSPMEGSYHVPWSSTTELVIETPLKIFLSITGGKKLATYWVFRDLSPFAILIGMNLIRH